MNNSTKRLALLTSVTTSYLICCAFALLYWLAYDEINWLAFFLVLVSSFSITFFIFKFTIENFIYNKIKLIYKTIHTYKIKKKNHKSTIKLDFTRDIISDVNTEVTQWAEESSQEIEQLRASEKYRREFLGNVSHELKTPIFSIQGYLQTLIDGGIHDPNVNIKYLERAEKNVDRLVNIVRDLDAISKLESGELKPNPKKFNIIDLVHEIFDELELKAKEKKIKLFIADSSVATVFVYADKEKIRQVFVNLLRNSISYGNAGGSTKISFFEMDPNILVEVTDTGVGIEQKDLPRIFERFYRTDESRSRELGGTGLGLAIIKHIIEAHDQVVNVRSTVGIGTTFGFTLKKG